MVLSRTTDVRARPMEVPIYGNVREYRNEILMKF